MNLILSTILAATLGGFGHGVPLTPPAEITSPPDQNDTRVATNGDGFLAAWTESRSRAITSVYAARFTRDGEPIDVGGVLVADDARLREVIWTGTTYLLFIDTSIPSQRQISVAAFGPDGPAALRPVFKIERIGEDSVTPVLPINHAYLPSPPFTAFASEGVPLIAYARRAQEPAYGDVPRIFLRAPDAPRRRTAR